LTLALLHHYVIHKVANTGLVCCMLAVLELESDGYIIITDYSEPLHVDNIQFIIKICWTGFSDVSLQWSAWSVQLVSISSQKFNCVCPVSKLAIYIVNQESNAANLNTYRKAC